MPDSIPDFRFIAFSLVSNFQLAHASGPHDAYERACLLSRKPGDRYIEVIDCQHRGRDIWDRREGLESVRVRYATVFRGDGLAPQQPAIAMGTVDGGISIVERDIDFYGREIERLQRELRRCNVWLEAQTRKQVEAARGVLKALLLFQLSLRGE